MNLLSTLIKYIGLYIIFFIVITLFVSPDMQSAIYSITGIAILATLAISLVEFFITNNGSLLTRTGDFFKRTMFKIVLATTGIAVIWTQFISSLFGV